MRMELRMRMKFKTPMKLRLTVKIVMRLLRRVNLKILVISSYGSLRRHLNMIPCWT